MGGTDEYRLAAAWARGQVPTMRWLLARQGVVGGWQVYKGNFKLSFYRKIFEEAVVQNQW